jgi:hypothetical protein
MAAFENMLGGKRNVSLNEIDVCVMKHHFEKKKTFE